MRISGLAADGHVYIGVDTGHVFHKLDWTASLSAGEFVLLSACYFVGSAALCSANLVLVGNDNGRLYALDAQDVRNLFASYNTGGLIRSSPAILYMLDDEDNLNRWVFVTSRGNGGKLLAFKTQIN